MPDDTSSLMGFLGSLYDRATHGPSIFSQPFGGAPANNKGVDPASVVRALKGDKKPSDDYFSKGEWHSYGPKYDPRSGAPAAGDMDKDPTHPIYQSPTNWSFPPGQEHGRGNRIVDGMFGVPQQRLQQMAGDVVPFPKTLIEQDQQRSRGPDWPLSNVKPFEPEGDMTGGGKVIPLPLPNVLSGLTPVG